jgi:hypothetical protein
MNSDSPLNWDKIAQPTIPTDLTDIYANISDNNLYPTINYNTLIFILIILLSFLICIFIYQQNKIYFSSSKNKQSCDDDDYIKWN